MKVYLSAILILLIFALALPAFAGGTLTIDGLDKGEITGTYIYHGQNYVEVEPVLAALEYETFWNENSGKLLFKGQAGAGVLSIHSPFVTFGASVYSLPAKPIFLDGRLCVPAELVQKHLKSMTGKTLGLAETTFAPAPPSMGLPYRPLYLTKVVIDAGHGGHDSGARSAFGLNEKDVNLAVAKMLASKLRDEMGIEVVMTRDDDTFITLGERARIANTSGAQLFFCIHANGAFNKSATGTETYFLSYEASDRKAARLAAAENASLRLEKDNPLRDSDFDDLKKILWDMVQTETMKDSERLATAVQTKLEQHLNLPSRGVKQAPFYVLMGSSIPAILVEIGFVTTETEARMLGDARNQEIIANALFLAIVHYDTLRGMELQENK